MNSTMTVPAAARKRIRDDVSAETSGHSSSRGKNPRLLLQNQAETKENGVDVSTELKLSYDYWIIGKEPFTNQAEFFSTSDSQNLEKFVVICEEEEEIAAARMGISLELKLNEDAWVFKKQFMKSDIDNIARLLISRKIVDNHIFCNWKSEEQTQVNDQANTQTPNSVSDKEKMKRKEDGNCYSTRMTDPASTRKRNRDAVSAETSGHSSSRSKNPRLLLQNKAETKENGFNVSTELKLYYDSWVIGKEPFKNQAGFFSTSDSQNLKNFVVNCDEEEIAAAARMGISLELKLYEDPWAFKKKLLKSDIDNLARLLISKKIVDNHIFCYWTNEEQTKVDEGSGVRVVVRDLNESTNYKLTFKRWKSSKSYILMDNWSKDFVRRRKLKEGDEIGLFWNRIDSMFCFAVLNRKEKSF